MGSEFVSNSGRKNVKSTENARYLPPTFACVTFVSRHVNTCTSDITYKGRVSVGVESKFFTKVWRRASTILRTFIAGINDFAPL